MKSYHPSRLWTFAMLVSTLLLFFTLDIEFNLRLLVAMIHLTLGYTFILPFYFIFAWFGKKIIAMKENRFPKKNYFSLLAFSFLILLSIGNFLIHKLTQDNSLIFQNYHFVFSLFLGILIFPIKYEYEPSSENILDDNFHSPKI